MLINNQKNNAMNITNRSVVRKQEEDVDGYDKQVVDIYDHLPLLLTMTTALMQKNSGSFHGSKIKEFFAR